ncbi:MAG: hypothetical protein ACOX8X_01305 [Methanomethylophilus sp.]|jgi:CheY-like chemotaxis protein
MKTLIVEDRDFMTSALAGALEKAGREYSVATDVEEALGIVTSSPERMLVVIDTGVGGGKGHELLNGIEKWLGAAEGRRERRERATMGPIVVIIKSPRESAPSSSIIVRKVLNKPFSTQEFTEALDQAEQAVTGNISSGDKSRMTDPKAELTRRGITYGEAYVVFEKRPDVITDLMKTFSAAGNDMFVVTVGRAKAVRDEFGLDASSPVFTLRGNRYPLGSMIAAASEFLKKAYLPVIAIEDLDGIIERCGLDSALVAIRELLDLGKAKKFTLLASADADLLAPSERDLLSSMMTVYKE